MLRVGLTGELGSGKSTVARLLAERGAVIMSSDEMGRAMMQPGEPVFQAIVERFGPAVLSADGMLDRRELARLAFDPVHPRVEELNAIVHPAVFAEQDRQLAGIAREQPGAIVVIESALLFSTKHARGEEPWRARFDRIILVTAPNELKVERFIARAAAGRLLTPAERQGLRVDAEQRLAAQRIPPELGRGCLLIENTGDLDGLESHTKEVFLQLRAIADDMAEYGKR